MLEKRNENQSLCPAPGRAAWWPHGGFLQTARPAGVRGDGRDAGLGRAGVCGGARVEQECAHALLRRRAAR